ncbi:MAG TPA: hypothetical protein VGE12_04700 [Noviherbaspirillum sp.]
MKSLLHMLSAVSSFVLSCFAIRSTSQLLDVLPVGAAHFPDTPVHGLTYGELFSTIVIILFFAFVNGLLHGLSFGRGYKRTTYIAATIPPIAVLLGFAAVTMGVGLVASPIVVAYGLAVVRGIEQGAKLKDRYCQNRIAI